MSKKSPINSAHTNNHLRRTYAFTLIEVLVVVAIIALLAAVLIPSLQRAREMAKIASCAANCKQIATITATYRSEFKGYVPILFNYGAEERGYHDFSEHFAMNSYLPVAFRNYDKGTKNLANMTVDPSVLPQLVSGESPFFLPDQTWSKNKRLDFETRIMPDHYACPFGRENGSAEFKFLGQQNIYGGVFDMSECDGPINAYVTWMWEGRVVKNRPTRNWQGTEHRFPNDNYPSNPVEGPIDGRPKYSVLSWSFIKYVENSYPYGSPPGFIGYKSADGLHRTLNAGGGTIPKVLRMHRKWKINDAQRQRAASLSEVTTVYCHLGNHTSNPAGRYEHNNIIQIRNPESHRTNKGGGTNVIFADTHVEWVKGTQVGWD